MGFFDEPIRAEVAGARRATLNLVRSHRPSHGALADLVELANRYPLLNPYDFEVKTVRDRLATHGA
jgi:hypothetical protein